MFKPMLAGKCEDVSLLKYPIYASPKLDGVRALVIHGNVLSRSLKLIPNLHVQSGFENLPEGTDGELIVGKHDKDVYRRTVSTVMSESCDECSELRYNVFDNFERPGGFDKRFDSICGLRFKTNVVVVPHKLIYTVDELLEFEQDQLVAGYEGVMIRSLDGPYKQGRSTAKEGFLLKLKRFADSEAVIQDMVELQHNENVATINALGHTERSTAKAGQVAAGVMGALQVQDIKSGVEFEIGTGFSAADREDFWRRRRALCGKIVKYKFFPMGSKDKPRFPVFLGFREAIDL